MDKLSIRSYPTAEEAALYGGYALNTLLEKAKSFPVLLLLSGGSAFVLLEKINSENLGPHVTISVLDERFGGNPETSNFFKLQKSNFYKEAFDKECNFIGTLARLGETIEQTARRFESALKTWKEQNPGGNIFITLGMGPDGHIAGIMPFPEDPKKFGTLFMGKGWVSAYSAEGKNEHKERFTATLTLIKLADFAVAYIAGPEKKIPFGRVKNRQNTAAELPAMAFWDLPRAEIYTDLA